MRLLLAAVLLFSLLSATVMEGEAYSADSLFPIEGVVLKASGPTSVQMVIERGNYSVELPPGTYDVSAYYYDGNSLKYYFREKVVVEGERMQYDLILFPPDEFEEVVPFVSYEIDEVKEEEIVDNDNAIAQVLAGVIIILFFLLGFVLYYFVFNKESNKAVAGMEEVKPHSSFRKELDSEEKKILEILKKNEGMCTQKELRGIMKCTDTKMSLLVSSLEGRGLVKRIKRGREKIVKLCQK